MSKCVTQACSITLSHNVTLVTTTQLVTTTMPKKQSKVDESDGQDEAIDKGKKGRWAKHSRWVPSHTVYAILLTISTEKLQPPVPKRMLKPATSSRASSPGKHPLAHLPYPSNGPHPHSHCLDMACNHAQPFMPICTHLCPFAPICDMSPTHPVTCHHPVSMRMY